MKAARFYDKGDIRIEDIPCTNLWKVRFSSRPAAIRIRFPASPHP